MKPDKETKQLGFETLRAAIENPTDETFDVVIATDRAVTLQGWKYSDNFEVFDEVFDFSPNAIRTERLDSGIPLFPSHWRRDSTDQLGISVGYVVEGNSIRASFRWGAQATEQLRTDVKNGIQKYVSMGTNNYAVEKTIRDGQNPVYKVIDWEIKHVAFAPEPADINCTTRSDAKVTGDIKQPEPEKEKDLLKSLLTK